MSTCFMSHLNCFTLNEALFYFHGTLPRRFNIHSTWHRTIKKHARQLCANVILSLANRLLIYPSRQLTSSGGSELNITFHRYCPAVSRTKFRLSSCTTGYVFLLINNVVIHSIFTEKNALKFLISNNVSNNSHENVWKFTLKNIYLVVKALFIPETCKFCKAFLIMIIMIITLLHRRCSREARRQ